MAGITTGLMVTDPQSSYAMRLGDLSAWKTASNVGRGIGDGHDGRRLPLGTHHSR